MSIGILKGSKIQILRRKLIFNAYFTLKKGKVSANRARTIKRSELCAVFIEHSGAS